MKKLALTIFCFLLAGIAFSNHWTPITGNAGNMTINCYIAIDNQTQTGTNLELGAFSGEECRASNYPQFFPPMSLYMYTLTIKGGETGGETISFRLYDSATDKELDLNCDFTSTYTPGGTNSNLGLDNPVLINFTTPVTTPFIDLTVEGHGGEAGHYVLLADPFTDEEGFDPANVHQVVDGNVVDATMVGEDVDYDLYYFDQTHDLEWINYRQQAFNLQLKKGYLYANKETVTLRFEGTPFTGDGTVTLDYYTDGTNPNTGVPVQFPGVNLIGNPFAENAKLDRSYFYMASSGDRFVPATTDERAIVPLEGVFVVATEEGENATFTPAATGSKISKVRIDVLMNRGELVDRAIVSFNANTTLPKFMLDPEDSKLYIAQNDREYAIVESNRENSLPVNFKAESNGTYTLAVNSSEVEMEYLHLIDNLTGADVDLLANPNYQFNATTSDSESRFVLAFKAMTGVEEQNQGNFCFVNGRNLYFCEETQGAEFNLVDMTGRTVSTQVLNGNCVSLDNLATGVYVVRLGNGDNAKTQKIMVK